MNPQYAAQQPPFGGFPPNARTPPGPAGQFQNVPLGQGPLKPTQQPLSTGSPMMMAPPGAPTNSPAFQNARSQNPQIPAGQLPPGQLPPPSSQMPPPGPNGPPQQQFNSPLENRPPGMPAFGNAPRPEPPNGPGQVQNGPPGKIMNGAGFAQIAPPTRPAPGPNQVPHGGPSPPGQFAGVGQIPNLGPHIRPIPPSQQQQQPPLIQPQLQTQPQSQSPHPPASFPGPPMEKNPNQPPPTTTTASSSHQPPLTMGGNQPQQPPPHQQQQHQQHQQPQPPPPQINANSPIMVSGPHPPSAQPQFGRPPMSGNQPQLANQPLGIGNQGAPPPQQQQQQQPPTMFANSFNQPAATPGQLPQMPVPQPLGGQAPVMPGQQPQMPGQQQLPQGFNKPGQFNQGQPGAFPPGGARMPPGPPGGPQQFNQQPGGQPPMFNSPNQLANQMQGMNLAGPRQYPQDRNVMNGGGPHMPPPLNQQQQQQQQPQPPLQPHQQQQQQQQQQYMNGQQQMRSPVGYPPMPGVGHHQPPGVGGPGPAVGGYPPPAYQQPQQAKRLDPDQMPSPIQVTQDDQANRSGVFYTNQKGLMPPLVTTNFVVQDQGNSSPRFIRSTMYSVPISQDIMKQTAVPFSLVISPMARIVEGEYPPPIVNFGDLGPVRCVRCKAYMCPFMQFIDSGRRFQCLFCKATTDVPTEYFQHLDHTGQRLDRYERPELLLGTYEFVATSDYCRNNVLPKPPAMIFVIDVSYNSIKSGLVHLLCAQMKEIIQNLPVDQGQETSNMRVGFITYNSSVHFYNIKGQLAAPQMLVVGDVQEMFMPLLDGFLCTPEESAAVIDSLMQQIPEMFGQTRETETILLPAILAGLEALKASECTGKLLVFTSTLPTAEAPGKLKNRDDRKLLGTDKEKTVLTPQTQAYNQLGQDCVGAGCAVDLFVFNNAYIDLATIGQVCRLTGGEVYKYTYFQADIDGDRLIKDIITDISRPIAFDSIMRVRTSTGVRPTDFYGHFFMSNTTDMELAAIDCDKAIGVEIKHDDKLNEEEGVYIQAALLYTSCSGQRRLRILNLSLKTCSQMADLYRSCDCDTIINYIAKQATYKLYDNNPKAVKDGLVTRAAQILATYRKNCASPSNAGQLILPECMKLLPLYINCLMKSDALNGGSDMTVDDRSFVMQAVMIMDIPTSVNYFYPRLIPLHEIDLEAKELEMPPAVRCTVDKMSEQGVYILENGIHMFLWIGLGASPEFIQKVFGVPSAIQVDVDRMHLPELDNDMSMTVRAFIDEIRIQRHRCMRLTLVRQREKLEPVFKHFLAEDRGSDGSPSYIDFLIHMHKEIRSLLS